MIHNIARSIWTKIVFIIFFASGTPLASIAQTIDVEIEIAGPWSYVPLPDSSRIAIVAPKGHAMAIFTGGDILKYPGVSPTPLGSHQLDFAVLPCGSTPTSSFFLYPANGVSDHAIQAALSSNAVYSISLPKPCSYDSQMESVFKYHGIRPITTNDPERSLTSVMTLHYTVAAATTGAVLDNDTGHPFLFSSSSGASSKAISIVLHSEDDPDKVCDSHSAMAFDAMVTLWSLPHVYRVFPKLSYTTGDLYNRQIPGAYTPTCAQMFGNYANTIAAKEHSQSGRSPKKKVVPNKLLESEFKAPGRADCHAAQVNVNGVVN